MHFQLCEVLKSYIPGFTAFKRADNAGRFIAPLVDGQKQICGALSVSAAKAGQWVRQFMGVSSAGTDKAELSQLEQRLLMDLCAAIVKGVWAPMTASGAPPISLQPKLFKGTYEFTGNPTAEYCRLALSDGDSGSVTGGSVTGVPPEQQRAGSVSDGAHPAPVSTDASCVCLVVLADLVMPILEPPAAPQPPQQAAGQLQAAVQSATVNATAILGIAQASVRDIMSLEAGDVLLIQRKVNEAIDLLVQGRHILRGTPVQTDGHYGLEVSEPQTPSSA